MKSKKSVITRLNALLTDQLTAINQFFLHARIFRNAGYEALDSAEYGYSIQAMKLADKLIQRVLFLEGLPNLQKLGKLNIGENVPESLAADMAMQKDIHKALKDAVAFLEEERDYVSRELVEDILGETEEHIDWMESQQNLIERMGLANYLQLKSAS